MQKYSLFVWMDTNSDKHCVWDKPRKCTIKDYVPMKWCTIWSASKTSILCANNTFVLSEIYLVFSWISCSYVFATYQSDRRLTHWGRMTHICVSKLNIIGSDNGLSPGRHQAIIWTSAGMLLIRTLGTNFSGILSEINLLLFSKIHLKMSSAKLRQCCLGFIILIIDIFIWLFWA